MRSHLFFLIRTAALLKLHAQIADASWVMSLAYQFFPEPAAKYLEVDVKREIARYKRILPGTFEPTKEEKSARSTQILFPSFV